MANLIDVRDVINANVAGALGTPVDVANTVLPSSLQIPVGTSQRLREVLSVPQDMGAEKELIANLLGLLTGAGAAGVATKVEKAKEAAYVRQRIAQDSDRAVSGYANLPNNSGLLTQPATGLPQAVLISAENPTRLGYDVVRGLNAPQAAEIAYRQLPLNTKMLGNPQLAPVNNQSIVAPLILATMDKQGNATQKTYNVLYELLLKNAVSPKGKTVKSSDNPVKP